MLGKFDEFIEKLNTKPTWVQDAVKNLLGFIIVGLFGELIMYFGNSDPRLRGVGITVLFVIGIGNGIYAYLFRKK